MNSASASQPLSIAQEDDFCAFCKRWRKYRKLSQLELALAADVSQRHVSWLETGRSKPSRDMVVRLSEAFDMPLRERNLFLQSAGFAHIYTENTLEEPVMQAVYDAISAVLKHHDPMPAILVDRFWNVRMKNKGADMMLALAGDADTMWNQIGDNGEHNLALLTVHPKGLRPYVTNWNQAGPQFIRRLKREALASGDLHMQKKFAEIIAFAEPATDDSAEVTASLTPVLPLEIDINGLKLSLFSVISTFGTPLDITTEELRIEAFYPANKVTEDFFASIV